MFMRIWCRQFSRWVKRNMNLCSTVISDTRGKMNAHFENTLFSHLKQARLFPNNKEVETLDKFYFVSLPSPNHFHRQGDARRLFKTKKKLSFFSNLSLGILKFLYIFAQDSFEFLSPFNKERLIKE